MATSNRKIEVTTKDAKLSLDPGDVTSIRDDGEERAYERLLHPSWGQLWAGTASLSLAGATGNAETLTFNTSVNAARVTNTDKTSLYFTDIRASALANGKNSQTANAVAGGISYDHNVSPRLFLNVFNDWQYDKFQSLDLRYVFGGGFGYHAVKTARSQLDLSGGFDYNHAEFSTPLTQGYGEYFVGESYSLKLTNATSIVQNFRYFDDLSKAAAYRANFDVGASTRIAKWLTWNISLNDRYLNEPAPGRKTNDFLYATGLGIAFAR